MVAKQMNSHLLYILNKNALEKHNYGLLNLFTVSALNLAEIKWATKAFFSPKSNKSPHVQPQRKSKAFN